MSAGDLLHRLRALLTGRRQDAELDEELRFHVEREALERVRQGAEPASAHREALAVFGGIERVKDEVREARGVQPLVDLAADARYALRTIARRPGFTFAVIAVLGIAIGAAATVFAVVDRVLLADLPYPAADRLVRIYQRNSLTNLWSLSTVDVQAIAAQQTSFTAFGAAQYAEAALSAAGRPEHAVIGRATPGFFAALEVRAARGRLIQPADAEPGAPPAVVVSWRLAGRLLGGPDAAVGQSLSIDGVSHTVVGVLEAGRSDLAGLRAEAWPVLTLRPPTRRGPFWMRGIARLKPGVGLEAAERDLAAISERIFPIWQSGFHDQTARLTPIPLRTSIIGTAGRQVGLFAGGVVLVLLVAIANVATLLLVRASSRQHELAVRAALGASRSRLARLVAGECLVLTILAGATGLLLAALCLTLVGVIAPDLPRLGEVALDARVLLFVAVVTLLSGLLVSLSPVSVVIAAGGTVAAPGDQRSGPGRRARVTRGVLVTAEFALALPLLLGAGLLLNSFVRLQRVDPGFDPDGVVSAGINLPPARYPDVGAAAAFWQRLELAAAAERGAVAAGLTSTMPPDNGGDVNNFDLLDKPVAEGQAQPLAPWASVTPGYFAAMKIPLLQGRLFTAADSLAAPPVIVVSRSWADRYYPGEPVLGKQLYSGGCTSCPPSTVIGVVGSVKYQGLAGDGDGVYEPVAQSQPRSLTLVVRGRGTAAETLAGMRRVLDALDPQLAPVETTLRERLRDSLADPGRWAAVTGGFAAAAALLAAVGIFGLMSYAVRQRRREMGVRLALGAEPASLTRLIVGRGMRYALAGTVIGLGLSLLESRWLGALLFGVTATDPMTIVGAAVALLSLALVACWLPGLGAARIRVIEVLAADG